MHLIRNLHIHYVQTSTSSNFGSLQLSNNGEEETLEGHPCICGFKGPIAKHLRVYFQCVQVLKEQVGIGEEMSDEEFCVRAALLVGQCPAFCCQGGDHNEIPESCVKWWKSVGWETMGWEGNPKCVTSDLIKKKSDRFVKDLEDDQAHQESQMNKIGRRGKSDESQRSVNLKDRMMDSPNQISPPSVALPKLSVQAAAVDQNHLCRNVRDVEDQTMEKVKAISRSETPGCLPVKELIRLGIRHAASLGISCRWPRLPINGNTIVPLNGNCIFTCFVHANNPALRGANLEQAVWELRVRAVGTFIDRLKLYNDEQWGLLGAIFAGRKKGSPSRDKIRQEMEKFMHSGEYSGDLGDILLHIAASFSQQPVLVIEVKNCKVTNSHWVDDPNKLFGAENHYLGCPMVILHQLNHYEIVLIAEASKDTAQVKYQEWKTSERIAVSPGRDNVAEVEYQETDRIERKGNMEETTMVELGDVFLPPITSTPVNPRNGRQEESERPITNVSIKSGFDRFITFSRWI